MRVCISSVVAVGVALSEDVSKILSGVLGWAYESFVVVAVLIAVTELLNSELFLPGPAELKSVEIPSKKGIEKEGIEERERATGNVELSGRGSLLSIKNWLTRGLLHRQAFPIVVIRIPPT